MMKKRFLIPIILVLLVAIGLSTCYLVKVLQEKKVDEFIEETHNQLVIQDNEEKQAGRIDSNYVSVYYPKAEDGSRIAEVENLIDSYLGAHLPIGEDEKKLEELWFIRSTKAETDIPNVTKWSLTSQAYTVDGFDITEKSTPESSEILLNEEYQVFTVDAFFLDAVKASEIYQKKLESLLSEKGETTDGVLDRFAATDLKEHEFAYQDGKITLLLDEAEFGEPSLDVELKELYDVLSLKYLRDADRTAYEEYQVNKRKNMIALTFDDGPNPTTTPQVLDILKKHNVKATFFVLGQNVPGNEDILKRMIEEGHQIANHSYSHANLAQLSPEEVKQEIEKTQAAVEAATGVRPIMMRPPYGSVNSMVMNTMQLPAIYWSVDTLDWEHHDPKKSLEIIKENSYPGGVILMHDIHPSTVESLDAVIDYLKSEGYNLARMSDMLGEELDPQLIYYDRDHSGPAQ